jgi:hypothetical protein
MRYFTVISNNYYSKFIIFFILQKDGALIVNFKPMN